VRNYAEDVADRNMAGFGDQEQRLDLNSPNLSYLPSGYASENGGVAVPREGGSHSRADSALDHVLGHEPTASDDIQPPRTQTEANSIHSPHTSSSRAGVVYPPRTDSTSALSHFRGHDDHVSATSNGTYDHRGRALSLLPTTTALIYEEPDETRRQPAVSSRQTDPIPARGQARTLPGDGRNPPVSLPSSLPEGAVPTQVQQTPSVTGAPPLKQRRRTMSGASQTTVASGSTMSRNGSLSYSAFPSPSHLESRIDNGAAAGRQPRGTLNKYTGMIVEGARELPSLEGGVDLSRTVDVDVATDILPGTDPPPLPAFSNLRPQFNTSRSLSTSFRGSRSLSNYPIPVLSPPCVQPRGIEEPPSFPPEDWPLPPKFSFPELKH
jgi:hypothetical protein